MMECPLKVAIVDDDAAFRLIAAAALDEPEEYALSEYSNGAALLAAMDTDPADLILLDIEMPGMNGIETCRALRAAGDNDAQVMFVSVHNDLETRLAAYDAGGNDFIVKPYEPAELARKCGVAREWDRRRRELGTDAQFARQTAFIAMSSMGEMGNVLEFLRESFSCETSAALARKMFDTLNQFGLDGLIRLNGAGNQSCFSSRGECTPLESGILDHAGLMERIFQFRDRLAVNYPEITLIAHPLPLAEPERVGRLRDHLAILAEGAGARLRAMDTARRQQAQASGIGAVIIELTATLDEIERQQAAHRLRATEIDESYLEELISAFVHLGLTETQESALAELAQRTHRQLAELRDEGSHVGDHLRDVARKLSQLIGR